MIDCKTHGKTSTYDYFFRRYNSKGIKTLFFERECIKCRQKKLEKEFKAKELKEFVKRWEN